MDIESRWYWRYGSAVGIVLISLLLRWELIPFIGAGTLYITVYPAIFIVAVLFGAGPGVFSAVLALLLVEIFLIEPIGQFKLSSSLVIRFLLLLFSSFYVGHFSLRLQKTKSYLEGRTRELRSSEERFRNVYETAPLAYVVWNTQCLVTDWNKEAEELFGWTKSEVLGKNFFDFLIPSQSRPRVENIVKNLLKDTLPNESINENLTKSGQLLLCEWHNSILHDAHGGVIGAISLGEDISERKWQENELRMLNRTLRAISDINQTATRVKDESEFLLKACRIVVEACDYKMAWIGFAEEDQAKTVRPVAYYGFEEGYMDTLKITWADTERGRGPTGTAIRTGQPTICRNMLTDPTFAPWRVEALKRGYASSIVLPFIAENKAFGAINIYSKEPNSFSEDEVRLLVELADDLAHGITTFRTRDAHASAERALLESEKRLNQSQEIAHLGSWELDLIKNELTWSDEAYRIFGLKPQEFGATYEAFLDRIHPDDRAAVDAAYLTSIKKGKDIYELEHRVVRKDNGEIRIVHEKCEHIRDQAGKIIRSIGMVQDITEHKQAEEKLARVQDELKRRIEEQLVESYKHLGGINRRISLLLDLEKSSHSKKNRQELADYILDSALRLSHAKTGFLYRYESKNEFSLISQKGTGGENRNYLQSISFEKAEFVKKLMDEKTRVGGPCKIIDPGYFGRIKNLSYFTALPLIANGGKCAGFMFLGFMKQRSVDTQELEFLDIFAIHAASALSSAGIFSPNAS